jgi:toxin YhaV
MSKSRPGAVVINGWTIYVHPAFLDQFEVLLAEVEALKAKDPQGYIKKNATKRLKAITDIAFTEIPQDPARVQYRQGTTLGDEYKHWMREKFFQQYRLFFRYHLTEKIIVLGWVNDEATKRAYGSKTDAYHTFRKMLEDGHPPDDWDDLLKEAEAAQDRLQDKLLG